MTLESLLKVFKGDPGAAAIFFVLGGAVIIGALLTITRRNPVSAVMSLVLTFFALAAVYASLSAHFLAVLQVSVYAGAIMVLFIFVVMILNRDEVERVSWRGIPSRLLGVLASGYVFAKLAEVVAAAPLPILQATATGAPADPAYGAVATVGASLFKDFTFPFEAISLLLLVAVVGGVVVSRSAKQEEEAEKAAAQRARIRGAIRPAVRVGEEGAEGGSGDHGHAAAHH
jgi:NADH-quinone oxidoreductase subunit J